jgi:uncharacterized protein
MRLNTAFAVCLSVGLSLFGLAACEPVDLNETGGPAVVAENQPDTTARAADRAAYVAAADAAITAAQATRGDGTPALWVVKDADTRLYLLGTVHLLKPDQKWRSGAIDSAFREAHTVVFEADVNGAAAQRDMMTFISKQGLFQDGRQLTSLMTAAEVDAFGAAAGEVGLPVDALQAMKPWFAAMNLSVEKMKLDGFAGESGVDSVLEIEARTAGKQVAYLETIAQQLGRLAALPEPVQVDFLINTVDAIDGGGAELDLLVAEWADGDAAGLARILSDAALWGSPEVYASVLKDRNADWVPQITAMLDTPGTQLIAVGAGHLVGNDSVIAMLRAQGYTVTGP